MRPTTDFDYLGYDEDTAEVTLVDEDGIEYQAKLEFDGTTVIAVDTLDEFTLCEASVGKDENGNTAYIFYFGDYLLTVGENLEEI